MRAFVAGDPAGKLRITVSGGKRRARARVVVTLSAEPGSWHPLDAEIPRGNEPLELELAWENPGPGTETRSLFLRGDPPSAVASRAAAAHDRPLRRRLASGRITSGAYGYPAPDDAPPRPLTSATAFRAERCIAGRQLDASGARIDVHVGLGRPPPTPAGLDGARGTDFDTLAESLAAAGYRTLAVTGGGLGC
jgi:hypothetical protein